jgi:hypothetical protein
MVRADRWQPPLKYLGTSGAENDLSLFRYPDI